MNIYRVDMRVCATAYIKANSPEQARRIACGLKGKSPDIADSEGEVAVSGLSFDNPNLPAVSLSPAMTIIAIVRNTDIEAA
ncbi:MAG: hypothetical protein GC182_09015 [Rhodopseudomonas sp.]|nr:hypothetical protein [Rhodopseudomonas sp.]